MALDCSSVSGGGLFEVEEEEGGGADAADDDEGPFEGRDESDISLEATERRAPTWWESDLLLLPLRLRNPSRPSPWNRSFAFYASRSRFQRWDYQEQSKSSESQKVNTLLPVPLHPSPAHPPLASFFVPFSLLPLVRCAVQILATFAGQLVHSISSPRSRSALANPLRSQTRHLGARIQASLLHGLDARRPKPRTRRLARPDRRRRFHRLQQEDQCHPSGQGR